jgi:hypothetical protein
MKNHATLFIAARNSRIGVRQPELGLHCLGRSAALLFSAVAESCRARSWIPEHDPLLFCRYDWAFELEDHCACRLRPALCSNIGLCAPEGSLYPLKIAGTGANEGLIQC